MRGPGIDPLLIGLAAGEERAFETLYDRFAARMYRAALVILGSREDAEDVVQEVFLSMVRAHEGLAHVRDLTAYLFASLRRAAIHRAQQRSQMVPASHAVVCDTPAASHSATPDDRLRHRLDRAIAALSDEQREVVTLKIDGELTFAQIAQVVGIGISTAASRYRYALQKLQTALADLDSPVRGGAMMDQWQLAAELDRLENLLTSRPVASPMPCLRERVLGDVRVELREWRRSRKRRLAARSAAVVLIGVALPLGAWQAVRFALHSGPSHPSVTQLAEQIQAQMPEFGREESVRQAMLIQIGAHVTGQPPREVPLYAYTAAKASKAVSSPAQTAVPSCATNGGQPAAQPVAAGPPDS